MKIPFRWYLSVLQSRKTRTAAGRQTNKVLSKWLDGAAAHTEHTEGAVLGAADRLPRPGWWQWHSLRLPIPTTVRTWRGGAGTLPCAARQRTRRRAPQTRRERRRGGGGGGGGSSARAARATDGRSSDRWRGRCTVCATRRLRRGAVGGAAERHASPPDRGEERPGAAWLARVSGEGMGTARFLSCIRLPR